MSSKGEQVSTSKNRSKRANFEIFYYFKGVGKGWGGLGELKPPQILTHVTLLQKNVEKREEKTAFRL